MNSKQALIRRYRQRTKRKTIAEEIANAKRIRASRVCGECTLCCTVMGVDELNKGPGVPCQHLLQIDANPLTGNSGCSIYGQHPESCRAYACMWRTGAIEDEDMRPDLIGVIFDQVMRLALDHDGDGVTRPSIATRYKAINIREAYPGAADQGKARMAVRILGQWNPLLLIGPDGKTRMLCGPDHICHAMLKEAGINPDDVSTGKVVFVD